MKDGQAVNLTNAFGLSLGGVKRQNSLQDRLSWMWNELDFMICCSSESAESVEI